MMQPKPTNSSTTNHCTLMLQAALVPHSLSVAGETDRSVSARGLRCMPKSFQIEYV